MKLIDFDEKLAAYINDWVEQNRDHYKRPEDMEDDMPDVYQAFLSTPADWLDGATPETYFDTYTDAAALCELLCQYIAADVPVPNPLLDRLEALGDEQALCALVKDKKAPLEARMHGVELLREIGSAAPMVCYLRWQVERTEPDDLLDNALESLRLMGDDVRAPAKVAFTAADDTGKEALLDVLCDYPGDDDVFHFALSRFNTQKDKRALYAGYLAKLGDDHALEALMDVAEGDDVSYIDFIEIRSAIERLGSEAPVRDFRKDPTYQAIKRLQ